ncbi:MAG: protein translocase subunit SecF [Clostridiales bacterium]|nr:protein translocase subunit SecF [Clostridiales bacterium]
MFSIMKHKWVFMGISFALMIVSVISLIVRGFNLDTDFAGGIAVTYEIKTDFNTEDVQKIVDEALGSHQSPSSIQRSNNDEVVVKFGYENDLKTEADRSAFSLDRVTKITTALQEKYDPNASGDDSKVLLKNQDIISPSTGQDLARSALWMSILACIAILFYVTLRFEFVSGVVAIFALIHDVLLLLGLYSIMQWSVDTNFIAAILTVLGYSINNTIVIMDRIRENTRHARKESYSEIADKSILQTMNRSLNTTITTLLTIGMVYILGVKSIQVFALPIIIGIVIGFYSSVFVAGPLWATWRDSAVNAKKKA